MINIIKGSVLIVVVYSPMLVRVRESKRWFKILIKHIQETVNYASEIALASRQQSVGTEQVASVMSTINEGMRTTANSAARILDEANGLKKLSKELSDGANTYKI